MKIIFTFFFVYILSVGLFSMGSGAAAYANGPSHPPVIIRNFSPHDYKAHKQNWSIIQDDRGIMYFANSSGVLEFDTIDWRLIPLPQGRAVYSLAKDRQGRIYAGGNGEIGYLAADPKGKLQYHSLVEKIPLPFREQKGRIIQVGVIPDGVVFLFERLLVILNEDRAQVFTAEDHFYCFIYIDGVLYIIDDTRGFLQLRGEHLIDVPGGSLVRAHVMLPFKDGKILILTTQQGPVIFDPAAKTDPYHPFVTPGEDFFSGNLISCGLVLDNHFIVLGSIEKGIAVFDPQGGQVSRIGPARGLQDRHIYGIYRDAGGNIWAGLDRGISLLRSPLFKTAIKPRGAAGGASSPSIPFAALIRGCRKLSDDSLVLDGAYYTPGNRVQSFRQQQHQIPVFSYAYNGFRFTFASNNYEEIEKTAYQCYMEGLDKGWSNWMDRTSREYTNLYWGKYTFRVRAKNYLGEISQEAAYTFRVKPPWHKTWWFLAGQIGFILSVLITSRLMEMVGKAQKLTQYMIIFAVLIIFEYFNQFIGPIIGRYSNGIAFFGMLMTALLSIIISPAQDFVLKVMKKIIKAKEGK